MSLSFNGVLPFLTPQEDFREIEDTAPPIRLREGIDIDELKNEGSMFELQDLNPSGEEPQCIVVVASHILLS